MGTCNMRKILICLIVGLSLLLAGCRPEESYEFALYSKEEVLRLYDENAKLFQDLVRVIENDRFFEKGRRSDDPFADAFLCTPYDEQIELFSGDEQQIILDFFTLKPYMINYDFTRKYITITFVCSSDLDVPTLGFTFLYWLDQGDVTGCRDHIDYLSGTYQFEDHPMEDGWYFYYKVN